MSSIYIHIPFCKKACHYCNFHFSTNLNAKDEMVTAIINEIRLRQDYLNPSDTVSSIYFGGGTPSLMDVAQLEQILETIYQHFSIEENVEITLEANPDDINNTMLREWKRIGINRFSMGVQSFFDDDLQWMNRAHNAAQSEWSIKHIQEAGFDNITIDLIYGTPTLTDQNWIANIQKAIDLNIPHLSCYALTVEEGTALSKMIAQKKKENTDQDKQARHFELLMQMVKSAGFEHYEVSNFAKEGYRSRHNSGYWQAKHYLGVGPSAHSFDGKSRQWNIAHNPQYIKAIANNTIPCEIEILTSSQQLNEYIMTSLRTLEGLHLAVVEAHWGKKEVYRIELAAEKFINLQEIEKRNNIIRVTDKGFLFADGIAAELFS